LRPRGADAAWSEAPATRKRFAIDNAKRNEFINRYSTAYDHGAMTMPRRLFNSMLILGAAAALVPISARDARAVLAHRYSFSGNANDSIGAAHGTVVDAGSAPNFTFTGGQLDLSANIGEGSNAITEDAYVDFPNNLITDVASAGTSGALSIEFWATVSETHTWQRFVDFGTSDGGEDTSTGGGASPYLYVAANSGRFTNGLSTEVHQPMGPLAETGVTGPLANGVQVHVAAVYNNNDAAAGPNGTVRLYMNGAPAGNPFAIPAGFDLNTFTNDNNWLGRSQWGDPLFDGSFNELRLYDHALTPGEVGANSILGPDSVGGDIFKLEVNKTNGQVSLTNVSTQNLQFDFYRITSAGNALNPAGWNSLDDQNFGAVDGPDAGTTAGDSPGEGFDQAPSSSTSQLTELNLQEAGATINASQSLALGNAFNPAVFGAGNDGDLQFTFGLVGGIQINGAVAYVTGGGQPGDFDGDGDVDGGDFLVWQRGVGSTHNAATLATWRSNFGAGGAEGAAGGVPEPASAILATLVAACVVGAVRRRE
jgi:hypothetical protein